MENTKKYQAIRKLAGEPKDEDKIYIDASDDEFGLMLNCAVRYAMGRETYMPHAVMDFIGGLHKRTFISCARKILQGKAPGSIPRLRADLPPRLQSGFQGTSAQRSR